MRKLLYTAENLSTGIRAQVWGDTRGMHYVILVDLNGEFPPAQKFFPTSDFNTAVLQASSLR